MELVKKMRSLRPITVCSSATHVSNWWQPLY